MDGVPAVLRGTLIAMMLAVLGIAAVPTVSYSTGARKHHAQCATAPPKSKAKRATRRAKCKKARKAPRTNEAVLPAVPVTAAPAVTPALTVPVATAPPLATPTGTTPRTTETTTILESAQGFIPPGISVVSVFAEAITPRAIAVSRTISEPQAIAELIDLTEGLERLQPAHGLSTCRASYGELRLELWFQESPDEENPPAEVTVTGARCGIVYIRIGPTTERAKDPQKVISVIEGLLGVEL
jgi:hypothetical protein